MTTPLARIVRGARVAEAPLLELEPGPKARRRIAREELEARLEAERILEAARLRAEEITAGAREQAVLAGEEAARKAREDAEARGMAEWLRLRRDEAERRERDRDTICAIAVLLAERLLAASLDLDPARVVDLARGVLAEARGARRITILAHPTDAAALGDALGAASFVDEVVEVRADEGLARGALRLQTDVGTIDAQLSPRLERLAAALRDSLP